MFEYEIEDIKEALANHGFEYIKYIGSGPFSSVVLCYNKENNQQYAIKRAIKRKISTYECDVLKHLRHPNIISLYNSFSDENWQYLVMEYCPNGTIRPKVNLSYNLFIYYARQILEALSYCHSNKIAHRDIKPDNIFIDEYNHIKLADFGFAKQFTDEAKSTDKCGSLNFLAPEIIQLQEYCPFKADIWALGITFFQMATGTIPFKGKTRKDLKQSIIYSEIDFNQYKVDPKIQFLINKMTAKNPKSRPSIDTILNYPMFIHVLSRKASLTNAQGRRNSYTTRLSMMTFIQNESSQNDEKNHQNDPLSYQCFQFHPKTQRTYSRPYP